MSVLSNFVLTVQILFERLLKWMGGGDQFKELPEEDQKIIRAVSIVSIVCGVLLLACVIVLLFALAIH